MARLASERYGGMLKGRRVFIVVASCLRASRASALPGPVPIEQCINIRRAAICHFHSIWLCQTELLLKSKERLWTLPVVDLLNQ